MRKSAFITILLGGIGLFGGMATAAERHVPSEYATIQEAINTCNNGDSVLVADGAYTETGNRDIDFMGKAITVKSENGPESCIIDCEGTSGDHHRGFYFRSGEGRNSVLEGFTITDGYVVVMCEAGAGIYISGASPTIKNCIITNNYAELTMGSLCYCYGGGIYIGGTSNPLITDSVISDNSIGGAWGIGGGIYCETSGMTLRNSIISNNTAAESGGICCAYGNLTIDNCTIANNGSTQTGGGIHLRTYDESPITTITNSIIWGNSPDQINANDITKILITYSDISGGWTGMGNINADPRFVSGPDGNYYLSQIAAGQAFNSPCVNAGSDTAENLGMDEFTTRTDEVIDEDIADMGYHYHACTNIVPNVVNMTKADANAALIAAGFVPGSTTGDANCTSVYDFNVISTTPAVGTAVPCGTTVNMKICECYYGRSDYSQWVEVGKPKCWCYPRQCHGDADGKKEGTVSRGFQYVGSNDLEVLSACWMVRDPPKGPGILIIPPVNGVPVACADFKHSKFGTPTKGYIRCAEEDLDEMSKYWLVKEPTKGPGVIGNCLPGNRTP